MVKFVVFFCAFALVRGDYYEEDHQRYDGPKHHPVITKYGVPLETPEVREARIHHFIAHQVAARNNDNGDYEGDVEYHHERYHGPEHYPIITKQGVPLETPEVREAKIHHHIAHEIALRRSHQEHHGDDYEEHHHQKYNGPKHYPIITKQGVPLETPAVRKARLQHHIAHEYAKNAHQEHHRYYELDNHHYGDSYDERHPIGQEQQEDGHYSYSYQIMHVQPNHHHSHHHRHQLDDY